MFVTSCMLHSTQLKFQHVIEVINETARRNEFATTKKLMNIMLKGYVDEANPGRISFPLVDAYVRKYVFKFLSDLDLYHVAHSVIDLISD